MTIAYTGMPLDRCTNQRKNKRWLTREFMRESTLFCVINDEMSLFDHEQQTVLYLTRAELDALSVGSCIYLGKGDVPFSSAHRKLSPQSEPVSVFAIDYKKLRFSTQEAITELGQWLPLRQNTVNLSTSDASIIALAKALTHWHTTHQFCGKCGNSCQLIEAGHARRCTHCRNLSFPRTDPAVIMLIERVDEEGVPRCLLGRQASWKQGMYSTLAGFVDPGETLEAAVIREVGEETSIVIENPQYITSQPWPFPASIMLGFTAVAISKDIDISQDDLEDAQWFSREQLQAFSKPLDNHNKPIDSNSAEAISTHDKKVYSKGSSDSISSYLINAWLNKEIGQF